MESFEVPVFASKWRNWRFSGGSVRTHKHFLLSLSCCLLCEAVSNPLTINVQITQQPQGGTWFSSCVSEGLERERCGNVKSQHSADQPRCLSRTKKCYWLLLWLCLRLKWWKRTVNLPLRVWERPGIGFLNTFATWTKNLLWECRLTIELWKKTSIVSLLSVFRAVNMVLM